MRALREMYGETVLLFFFPAIVAWLIALAGYTIPDGNGLLVFIAYWMILESLAFLYFVKDIKNRKAMGANILFSALMTFVGTLVVITGAPFSSHGLALSDDTSDEDAERMYLAGVALMSALMPVALFVLLMLLLLLLSFLSFL